MMLDFSAVTTDLEVTYGVDLPNCRQPAASNLQQRHYGNNQQ